jgi:capsular polysaccharide biosynthesis protein
MAPSPGTGIAPPGGPPRGLPPLPGPLGARPGGPGRPGRPPLSRAQQGRLRLVCALMVLVGVAGGLLATVALPHVYAAQVEVLYNLGDTDSSSGLADTTLTTQTLLITSDQVLQPVSASTTVPVDYLQKNVKATVVPNTNPGTTDDSVPNSEVLQIEVDHPDRISGVELANAIAKRYLQVANGNTDLLEAQLDNAQRQLSNPATPPESLPDLQSQVTDLTQQITQDASSNSMASIVGPAYSRTAAVFPNTLITLAIGALAGVLLAALVGWRMVSRWTRR